MSACALLAAGEVICACATVGLLWHHWHKHLPSSENSDGIANPHERIFQRSDLCNFRTCNHEMWVVAAWVLGAFCTVMYGAYGCSIFFFCTCLIFYLCVFMFVVYVLTKQATPTPPHTQMV